MAESFWIGEFDDVDLEEEAFFDLIEEILSNMGFMIVEKDWDGGKIIIRLKLSHADSIGYLNFKKDKQHISISIIYEIMKPDAWKLSLDEKSVGNDKARLEDSWKNLCRMIDNIFSSGFIPAPELRDNLCSNCGREIDWDSKFCKYCGYKLE